MNKNIKLIIFITVIYLKFLTNGLNVLNSTITLKELNILGAELYYTMIELEMDSDIYKYDALACPNYQCTINTTKDCSCDYTVFSDCPKKIGRDPSCPPCPTPTLDYCPSEQNWITVEKDIDYVFESNKTMYLRYKANSSICEGLMVRSYPIKGFHNLKGGSTPINTRQRSLSNFRPQIYGVMNLCPSDQVNQIYSDSWSQDTFFFTIMPYGNTDGKNVSLSFRLTSKEISSEPIIRSTCTSPVPTTHRCIYDGEFIYEKSEASTYHFFVFNATKSAIYTIRSPQLEQFTRIYASKNSKYPQLNGFGNTSAEYTSIDEFENSITIYLEKATVLFISIEISYTTNYSLSITSQGYYLPVNISSLPPKAGAYALVKSSQLFFNDSGSSYDCDAWDSCTRFSVNYPFSDSNPLNPIPAGLYSIPNYYILPYPMLDYDEEIFLKNPVKPKSITLSVLYAYRLGISAVTYLDSVDEIRKSFVRFKSNFFDKDGNALNNVVQLTEIELTCNYEEFLAINNAISAGNEMLYNITDINVIMSYGYILDSLSMRNSWVGCNHKANSLFETSDKTTNHTLIYCGQAYGTPEFDEDPCCNVNQKYFKCCNPKVQNSKTTDFSGLSYQSIQSKCSSPSCTESILSQYNSTYNTLAFCNLDNGIYDNLRIDIVKIVRSCKTGSRPTCTNNSDCIEYAGPDAICDLFDHACTPNYKFADYKYLKCVFSQLDQVTTYNLLHKPFSLNNSIIDEIYEKYQKQDCTTEGTFLSQRQKYRWDSPEARYQDPNKFYPSGYGLDDSQPIIHDLMYDRIFNGFQRAYSWSFFDYCANFSICPWVYNSGFYYGFTNDPNAAPLIEYCNTAITGFCGNCANGLKSFCNTFDFGNQANCEQTDYCLMGANFVASPLNMTQQQCESYGSCSNYCGYQCSFKNPIQKATCVVLNVNQTLCTSMSYTWDASLVACIDTTATSKSQCTNHWLNCTEKLIDECAGPLGTLFGYCSLEPIYCQTKEECENAGVCSDSYFFNPINTQAYPLNLGKCVRGHHFYREYPSCEYNINGYIENDSPMGCFSYEPLVLTKSDCEALDNHTWWSPATNKQECLNYRGCKTYFTSKTDMLPYNTLFNEMSEEECLGCYDSQNEYTNKFEWTAATWIPGTLVKGKWYTPDPITNQFWTAVNNLTTTLDYEKLYDDLVLAVDSQMTDQIRSSYFCRNQRYRENLDSIACSCSDVGGYRDSTCFKDTAMLLGQSKPCSSKTESFNFQYGFVGITNSSVDVGCGDMLVYQFSRDIFISTEGQSFPSNFVSYPKPDNFGLFNNKSAIVGTIIGDGITIESKSIHSIVLCFLYTGNPDQKKYPILDFGCQDQDTGILHPMGLDVYLNSLGIFEYLCSNITHLDPRENFFPINRIGNEDWRMVEKKFFDQRTLGLLYTLAAIYLVVLIYGFYQLVIVTIIRFKKIIHRFELVHLLLLMIFVFLLVRTIYFFLLPSGKLSNSAVADYILVVLPTFFYFSCFTVIIVLWYVIVVLVLKNNSASNFSNRLFSIVGLVNIVIYLLLVAIILVFQYTKDVPNEFCGSRIIFNVSTSRGQKTVSILYAVIQALISLVLGVAFVYLGGSLYRAMRTASNGAKKGGLDVKRAHSRELKIFLLTTICSTGFLLHCLFIIILVALNEPSIVFSFIGLIITEIIPSITILYCYDQRTSLSLDITLSSKSVKSTSSSSDTKLQTISENLTLSQNLSSE